MSEIGKEVYIHMPGSNAEVGVRVPMEHYYRELMDAVEASPHQPMFISLVACIVWGSLYIEATVNRAALDVFSENPFGKSEGGDLWELAEKADLESKVKVMAQKRKIPMVSMEEYLKILRRLAKIRNRLVHYKERFTKVNPAPLFSPLSKTFGSVSAEELATLTTGDVFRDLEESLANPDIVHAVQSSSLAETKRDFTLLGEWIAGLRHSESTVLSK